MRTTPPLTRIILAGLIMVTASALSACDITFRQIITDPRGLSQNTVRTIAVDRTGYVWAGTLDGLNRYDGYHVRAYELCAADGRPLSDHRIRHLYATRDSLVWVRTYMGEVCVYDPRLDRFTYITDETGQATTYANFHEAACGDVWLWDTADRGVVRERRTPAGLTKQRFLSAKETCNFLAEDSLGYIWFGGKNGLHRVSPEGEPTDYYTFRYHVTQGRQVGRHVCFSTMESVVLVYDPDSDDFRELPSPIDEGMTDLFRLSDHEVMVLHRKQGLYACDLRTGTYSRSTINDAVGHFATDVMAYYDNRGGTWFSTKSGLIWYLDGLSGQIRTFNVMDFRHNFPDRLAAITFEMTGPIADSEGLYWFGSYGYGLFCYDPADGTLSHFTSRSGGEGLPTNYLLDIDEDAYGNLWIGTEYAGVVRASKGSPYARMMRIDDGTVVGKHNNVRAICPDSDGDLWIGLKNGGLYVYDAELTRGQCVDPNLNPYTIAEDEQGRMWVGSKATGLHLFDRRTRRRIAHLLPETDNPASIYSQSVFHLMRDSRGRMWVCMFDNGGLSVARESHGQITFQHFLTGQGNASCVRHLFQDSQGLMWAATADGLVRFNPDELIRNPDEYVRLNAHPERTGTLSGNDIKLTYEDRDGRLWVGTAGGGLNRLVDGRDSDEPTFRAYTTREGMPDNYALGILDDERYLYISTEHGLARLDKTDESIIATQPTPGAYAGIFNETACLLRPDGTMLWGTLDGLLIFHPDLFRPDTGAAPVLITGLTVEGLTEEERARMAEQPSITYAHEVILAPNENTFAITFASLDLSAPELNRYTYRLEGYDAAWSTPSTEHTAAYKNMPPGRYTFRVRAANSFGVWNADVTELRITVRPPFYRSTAAYTIYILIALAALAMAFRTVYLYAKRKTAALLQSRQATDDARPDTALFLRIDPQTLSLSDAAFLQLITRILEENSPDPKFGIDRFVELSGHNRTTCFKRMRDVTGLSPNELIKAKRLTDAARLLVDGRLGVAQVSYRVGFDDPYYFSKCFKARFGLTPKAYREAHRTEAADNT